MIEGLLLVVILVLVAANALFVAAEFSLVTVDRAGVERAARSGDGRADSVLAALRTLSTQLSGAQLGITITSLAVGFLIEPSLGELLRGPISLAGLPDAAATALAVGAALVVATAFQMVFGELVPKNWAIAEPMRLGRMVAGPQRGFTAVSSPLLSVLNGSANGILRAFGIEPQEELRSARRPQELSAVAGRSRDLGALDAGTAELLQRAVDFGERTAADVMTPRPRVRFLSADDPVAEVLTAVGSTGHARFPVLGASVDDVVGAVHFKHALAVPVDQRGTRSVREVMAEVLAVPPTLELEPLLHRLRQPGWQLAVVVDEYGGTAGVVTFEDLVEEIVGEIADEQDRPWSPVNPLPGGGWSLSGLLRTDEVERQTGLLLPEPLDSETLAGLVQERLGTVPVQGDAVELDARDVRAPDDDGIAAPVRARIEVTRMEGRRADRLHLSSEPVVQDGGKGADHE